MCIWYSVKEILGFMVSQRGVKANPDKVRAIMEMAPPKNIMEVQSLNIKVVALNRFASRATDKCLSFFKVLQKLLSGPMSTRRLSKSWRSTSHLPPLLSLSKPGKSSPST